MSFLKVFLHLFFSIVLIFLLSSCDDLDSNIADLALINGNITTINDDQPHAEAIAVKGDTIKFIGSNLKLPNDKGVFTGELIYDSKGAWIPSSSNVEINGLSVSSSLSPVYFYFQGEEVSGADYVYFGESEFVVSGDKTLLTIDKENKYVKIEEGDYFSVSTFGGRAVLNKGESDEPDCQQR